MKKIYNMRKNTKKRKKEEEMGKSKEGEKGRKKGWKGE